MQLRDFRIGWRLLAQQPLYSAVVVFGLTLGFAASFLLLGYAHYSFSYDDQAPDSGSIYVFKHKLNLLAQPLWTELMPAPARAVLQASSVPMTLSSVQPREAQVKLGGRLLKTELTMVDTSFPALFGLRASSGDLAAALDSPDGVALTATLAQRLFGAAPALGLTIEADGQLLRVLALLPDAPPNTTVPYGALIGPRTVLVGEEQQRPPAPAWNALAGKLLVRPGPGVQPETLRKLVQDAADRHLLAMLGADAVQRMGQMLEVRLAPLAGAYFDTEVAAFHGGPRADRKLVLALAAVALLILLVAATNYVNLATVRTLRRQREIGIRKAMGAGAARLVGQFMAEAITVALSAAAAGLLLAWLLLPIFSELVDRKLDAFFTPWSLLAGLGIGALAGILTGIYPARLALRVRPQAVLAGRDGDEVQGAAWLRRSLTVFQLAAAMALTALALAIVWQASYAGRVHPGFNPAGLTLIELPQRAPTAARLAFRDALARLPVADGVAAIDRAIGAPGMPMSDAFQRLGGRPQRINLVEVSPNFFDVYRLAPSSGRLFDPRRSAGSQGGDVVINEAAVQALGFAAPDLAVGQVLKQGGGRMLQIVGVAPLLRHQSLREPLRPVVYLVNDGWAGVVTLRSHAEPLLRRVQVERVWRNYFPDEPLDLRAAGSVPQAYYVEDWRGAKLLLMASVIATGIAAFGIYVLAAYSVQRRSREIALRKLHGAGARAIAGLVVREFMALTAVAAALGLPLAALAIEHYLAGYTARAPMGWWPLLAALLLAALVALAASLRHTLAAMRLAPAAVLRG